VPSCASSWSKAAAKASKSFCASARSKTPSCESNASNVSRKTPRRAGPPPASCAAVESSPPSIATVAAASVRSAADLIV
jgi:hypothetical protein